MHHTPITAEMVAEHGLKPEEYALLLRELGREPTLTELGIVSVMWSEHCSYKSSRVWLSELPTKAEWVIQGPGENAGVIDIGDGDAIVFKMESHNHPSFIEPYQGAATGVGGIMRDVFTMGARPIAMMNALRFGAPDHPRTKHLVSGVVAGIGGYGNCMGVPTVGGETNFDAGYNGNILVNAMCVGHARTDKIFYSAAKGIGLPVVYVGAKTGRDGIHGATMASAEFSEDSEEKRPTVQVGDPFKEKLLLEACLELMAQDAIIAIQDMGAAGLTSSSAEMADKGGVGIHLVLDAVPQREPHMTAYEMMLSESQERMLMVLRPGSEADAEAVFRKWELDFAVIGKTTDTGRMVIEHNAHIVANLPVGLLGDSAPRYERPFVMRPHPVVIPAEEFPEPDDLARVLLTLIGSEHLCSRRWIWEQYDHMVGANTLQRPGGDAAVVRIHGTQKAVAITTDCTPRYCAADPMEGGKQAVAEAWRNLTAVGALPLAITDNMNFGNPERPEIMGEFGGCIRGMRAACLALDFPVVSGNVSLYNETNGVAIPPTPAIGGVGLLADYRQSATLAFKAEGESIVLVGGKAPSGHLGQSLYQLVIEGERKGAPPPVDLAAERRAGDFIRQAIHDGLLTACHDVADGGVLVALTEMALAGDVGCQIDLDAIDLPSHAALFGEDQGLYCVTLPREQVPALTARAQDAHVWVVELGETIPGHVRLTDGFAIALPVLREAHEGRLPALMG